MQCAGAAPSAVGRPDEHGTRHGTGKRRERPAHPTRPRRAGGVDPAGPPARRARGLRIPAATAAAVRSRRTGA